MNEDRDVNINVMQTPFVLRSENSFKIKSKYRQFYT